MSSQVGYAVTSDFKSWFLFFGFESFFYFYVLPHSWRAHRLILTSDFRTNLVRGLSNKEMKFQNKGAVPVQIAPLLFSQPRNQNQSIALVSHQQMCVCVCVCVCVSIVSVWACVGFRSGV